MKTKILLLLIILGYSCFSSFSQNAIPNNAIPNGDFEINYGYSIDAGCNYFNSSNLPGWNHYVGTPEIRSGSAQSGSYFIAMWNAKGNDNIQYTEETFVNLNSTVRMGGSVTVKFWIKSIGVPSNKLHVYLTSGLKETKPTGHCAGTIMFTGQEVGSINVASGNTNWTQYQMTICNVNSDYNQIIFLPYDVSMDTYEKWIYLDNVEAYVIDPFTVPTSLSTCPNQPVTITASGAKWYAFGSPSGLVQGGYSNTYTASYPTSITMHVDGDPLNGCPVQRKYVNINVIPSGNLGTTTVQDNYTIPCASDVWKQWRYQGTTPGATNYYWTYKDIYNNTINTTSTELFISSGGSAGYVPVITVHGFNQCGGTSSTISFLAETTRSYPTCINAPARIGIVDEPTDVRILNTVNNIEIQNLIKDDWNIIIISIDGKEVKRAQSPGESDVNINTADLKAGIYIVKMESSTGKTIQKKIAITQ